MSLLLHVSEHSEHYYSHGRICTFPNYFSTVYYPPHQQLHFTSRQYDHPKAPCYLKLQINMLGWGGVGLTLWVKMNF